MIASPYLLFLGDTKDPGYAKTAFGLRDWAGERCVGELAEVLGGDRRLGRVVGGEGGEGEDREGEQAREVAGHGGAPVWVGR